MYQIINDANKNHQSKPNLFFKNFNAPIAATSQALSQENQKLAEKLQAMAENVAEQGQMKRGQLLAQAASTYHKMAQLAIDFGTAYESRDKSAFSKALSDYIRSEHLLRTNNFQIVLRPWFTMQECSIYLRSIRK
jgi:hypothetical protein